MGSTGIQLRDRVEVELGDELNLAYTTGLLDQQLADAVETLGMDVPVERESAALVRAGDGRYGLPADILGRPTLVKVNGVNQGPTAWRVWNGKLEVASSGTGDTVIVEYRGRRSRPTINATDLGLTPDEEMAVLWLTCAQLLEWEAANRETNALAEAFTPTKMAEFYRKRYASWLAHRTRRVTRHVLHAPEEASL